MRQFKIGQGITDRNPLVEDYFRQISKSELLTPDEEVELAQRIKEGDERAKEKLVKANLRFVVSVARQYQNKGMPLSDLINEGNIGLIKAAENFDETRGFRFISYAVWWIRKTIMEAISKNGMIKLPRNKFNLLQKVRRATHEFEQKNLRLPSPQEIAEMINESTQDIEEVMLANQHITSISEGPGDDEGMTFEELVADPLTPPTDDLINRTNLDAEINRVLSRLPERERLIIRMLFGLDGEPMTLEQIGDALGISPERARQLKERALKKLRRGCDVLKNFMN